MLNENVNLFYKAPDCYLIFVWILKPTESSSFKRFEYQTQAGEVTTPLKIHNTKAYIYICVCVCVCVCVYVFTVM